MAGNTVQALQATVGQAHIAVIQQPATANIEALAFRGAVFQHTVAAFLVLLFVLVFMVMLFLKRCSAGNFVVIAVAFEAVYVDGKLLGAAGVGEGRLVFVGNAVVADGEGAALFTGRRHAVVDNIDHTTNSTRAVEQRGGAAQNFNLLGSAGLSGYHVVGADPRGVADVQAILGNQHARAVKAANNGAAGNRTKITGVHAHFIFQGFAQR